MKDLKSDILQVLASQPPEVNADSIAAAIGEDPETVRSKLEAMESNGEVVLRYLPPLVSLAVPVPTNQPTLF